MLNIHIDNQELEQTIKQAYGDDSNSLARAFFEFIQQKRIKEDIGISIKQLESGEGIPLRSVIKDIRSKYE